LTPTANLGTKLKVPCTTKICLPYLAPHRVGTYLTGQAYIPAAEYTGEKRGNLAVDLHFRPQPLAMLVEEIQITTTNPISNQPSQQISAERRLVLLSHNYRYPLQDQTLRYEVNLV